MEMSEDEDDEPVLPKIPPPSMQRQEEVVPWRFSPVSPWAQGVPTQRQPVRKADEPPPAERARRRLDFSTLPSLDGLRKVNPVTAPDALALPRLFPQKQQPTSTAAAAVVVAAQKEKPFQITIGTYEDARMRLLGVPHVVLRMPSLSEYTGRGAVPTYQGFGIFSDGNAFDRDQMPPHIRLNLNVDGRGDKPMALEFRRPVPYDDPRFVHGIDDTDSTLFPLSRGAFAPEWTLFRLVPLPDKTGMLRWHIVESDGTRLGRNFFGDASNIGRIGVILIEPDMPVRTYLFTRPRVANEHYYH